MTWVDNVVDGERLKVVTPSVVVREWKPKLIGLAGRAQSGKDTVAQMLRTAYPVKSLAFADPIRGAFRGMDMGLTDEHFFGELKEQEIDWIGKSYRQMAQTLGTDWGREMVKDNLWVLIAGRKVDAIHASGFHAAITDVRFDNEAKYIRERGGVIWHIHRKYAPQINAHKSEAGVTWDDRDFVISNNGTLDELFDLVCDTFEGEL